MAINDRGDAMAINDRGDATQAARGDAAAIQHQKRNFGMGMFFAFLAGVLGLCAVVFIWLGVIPSLVLMVLCVPLSVLAARLLRKGKPADLPE